MKAQPIRAAHRIKAYTPATATMAPQSAPSSAMPANPVNACRAWAAAIALSPIRSDGVVHCADDAGTRIAQHADGAGGGGDAGVVLARQHDRAAGAKRQALRIGVQARRRCVEQND